MASDPPVDLLRVSPSEGGLRLDQLLVQRLPALGRRGAQRLLEAGLVTLQRRDAPRPERYPAKGTRLAPGDAVLVAGGAEGLRHATPVQVPPRPELHPDVVLLYEDAELVVVSKPPGVPSHPLAVDEGGTVANHLASRYPECLAVGGPPREAGLAHRLDTLASGLLVAARTAHAHAELRRQFHDHEVEKRYLVLVWGHPLEEGVVEEPIASRPGRRKVTVGSGQAARTEWRRLVQHERTALLDVAASTGRRHQVRAHLAHAGHPLTDDALYGGAPFPAGPGPLLHAHSLTLQHPAAQRRFTFRAPLFAHQQAALERLSVIDE